MARENGRDYIYLVWKEPISRRQYTIAKLSKNGKYEFEYAFEIADAIEKGFQPFVAFQDINKKYESEKLFASFSSRIPDRRRKNIGEILKKYGLDEYDEYKLLKRSGGRLPIDNLEFIDPIIINGQRHIKRIFNTAGQRHYLGCNGGNCNKSLELSLNEELVLELDPNNDKDKYAIKICNKSNDLIAYIPRYYNRELFQLINSGWKYTLIVSEFNKYNNCNECLKVKLSLYLEII